MIIPMSVSAFSQSIQNKYSCFIRSVSHQTPTLDPAGLQRGWDWYVKPTVALGHESSNFVLEFFDTYDKLIPCYDIEPVEKITDAVRAFSF